MKNAVKELKPEELAKAAGGNIIDDLACHFGDHDLEFAVSVTPPFKDGHQIDYVKSVCKNCKKVFYHKHDWATGKWTRINHEEFEAYDW